MGYTITANITPQVAVRLLIANEIDIGGYWETEQAEALLKKLYDTDVTELLRIVDCIDPDPQVAAYSLPQFGTLDTLIRVPEVLVSKGMDGLSYAQLGFYLKNDVMAKMGANAKYGETHGKGACQLGIVSCEKATINFGALTNCFYGITDKEKQSTLAKKLCFRIPVIQTLLNQAKNGRVNGFAPMSLLENSTKHRRAICVRMILKELRSLNSSDLDRRIDNIYWDLEEGIANVEV